LLRPPNCVTILEMSGHLLPLGPATWLMAATFAVAGCNETPSGAATASSNPDQILIEREKARAALTSQPRASPSSVPPAASSAPQTAKPARPAAGPDVLALLDGLGPGDRLGPAEVAFVSPVAHGTFDVELKSGATRGALFVGMREGGPAPAASSDRYAVYYWNRNTAERMSVESLQAACSALAERLRRTEARVPVPSGMTGFTVDASMRPSR